MRNLQSAVISETKVWHRRPASRQAAEVRRRRLNSCCRQEQVQAGKAHVWEQEADEE